MTRDERERRILCLGDSYTVGEGVEPAQSWPHLLVDRLGGKGVVATLRIVGRTGLTAAELTNAIGTAELRPPYDLVTVQAGVNDQYRGQAPNQFADDLAGLLDSAIGLAGGRPNRVLMVSIPDWSVTPHGADFDRNRVATAIDAFNQAAASTGGSAGIEFVDVTGISRAARADPALTAGDGLHPSAAMYRRWVEAIAPVAERITGIWV